MDEQNKAATITNGFLSFLKKEKCLDLLPKIIEGLTDSVRISKVNVISPIELDDSKKDKTIKLIRKLTNLKVFNVEYKVDESMIDGIKIIYGDKMWDMSLSTQIKGIIGRFD